MQTTGTLLENGRESWENEGGSVDSAGPTLVRRSPTLLSEPFPAVSAGDLVLRDLELVRLVDTGTLGKYRVQPSGTEEGGPVFLVTLFGATCAKVEILVRRKLDWRDYLTAMKSAIEREIGYWQNRGGSFPPSVEVTVRDTDFAVT